MLLVGAELLHVLENALHQPARLLIAMPPQAVNQAPFPELLAMIVEGFGGGVMRNAEAGP